NVGLAVYLPVYMQSALDLSASDSGIALLGFLLGTVAGAMTSGRMVPKMIHYKRIALLGAAFSGICLCLLGFVAADAPFALIELLTVGVGLGTGASFPIATVSVQNAVDQKHLGVATGVLTFLRSLGGALGVALLGAVALGYGMPLGGEEVHKGSHAVSAAAFETIFFVCAAIMMLALLTFWLMPEKRLRGRGNPAAVVE
ncbi:MAG: MFS transporter, partial [Phyllobacterium sp.]